MAEQTNQEMDEFDKLMNMTAEEYFHIDYDPNSPRNKKIMHDFNMACYDAYNKDYKKAKKRLFFKNIFFKPLIMIFHVLQYFTRLAQYVCILLFFYGIYLIYKYYKGGELFLMAIIESLLSPFIVGILVSFFELLAEKCEDSISSDAYKIRRAFEDMNSCFDN